MKTFRPKPQEVKAVQEAASLCENHLRYAAGRDDENQTGSRLLHQEIAADYSRIAFALAHRVAARSRGAAPGLDLHRAVRAGFIAQGTSLNKWCLDNSILPSNARDVLIGRWNGPKGQELRNRIAEASGMRNAA